MLAIIKMIQVLFRPIVRDQMNAFQSKESNSDNSDKTLRKAVHLHIGDEKKITIAGKVIKQSRYEDQFPASLDCHLSELLAKADAVAGQ